tara:strand:+ start:55 stop:399 length:345 start_codon:yes stop_codon:yes gene_type:complete
MLSPSKHIIKLLPDYFKKSKSDMKELLKSGDNPLIETKEGWIEFEILDNVAFVYTAYSTNHDSVDNIWDTFIKEVKKQGCNKIEMITHRNPKVWEKLYNFKLKESKMVLDLKGE